MKLYLSSHQFNFREQVPYIQNTRGADSAESRYILLDLPSFVDAHSRYVHTSLTIRFLGKIILHESILVVVDVKNQADI